jgi:hypothetical protein
MALAYRDFAKVPPENYRELAFEDLTAAAGTSLAMLAEFFELPDDPGWIDRAARLVNGAVRVRAPELPADEFTALSSACRAGQILTGRAQAGGLNEVMATLRSAWLEIGRRPGTSET